MRSRYLMTVIAVALVTVGCGTSVDGRGSAAAVVSDGWTQLTGPTLGVPSADGPATRAPESSAPPATSASSTTASSTTASSTAGSSPSTAPGSTAPQSTAPGSTAPESTAAADVLSGPIAIGPGPDGYLSFQSPSGNIFCGMSGDPTVGVRCDLVDATYPDLAPVPCDFGDFHPGTASLDADGQAVVGACISDTVIDPSAVMLPYGSNAGAGDVVCHSAEDGVTCGNLVTGHGFQVARTAYRVF